MLRYALFQCRIFTDKFKVLFFGGLAVLAEYSALLCYERAPGGCHRTLLLRAIAPDADVVDLFA